MVRLDAESHERVAMPGRGSTRRSRSYSATLNCGLVLTYEAFTLLPGVGEVVPCYRHGYCTVNELGVVNFPARRDPSRARPRRSQEELLAFLSHCPVTTVHVLRRNRFTLRTVAAAQREGLVEVDLVAGRVALRPTPG